MSDENKEILIELVNATELMSRVADAVNEAVDSLKNVRRDTAASLQKSGADIGTAAATAKAAAEEARKVVASAAGEMKAVAEKMEKATNAHIAATKHKPPIHRSTWVLVVVLSLLVILHVAHLIFTPTSSGSNEKVAVYAPAPFDCMQVQWRWDGPWGHIVKNSWVEDKDEKGRKLGDGWGKFLCMPGCEELCKPCLKKDADGWCIPADSQQP